MTTKAKLLKLADFLEQKVKDSWFDLGTWGDKGFPKKECGATACAAGWATVCFPRSGLTLLPNSYVEGLEIAYRRGDSGRYTRGFAAVMAFFEIDREAAEHLFDHVYYIFNPGHVILFRRLV